MNVHRIVTNVLSHTVCETARHQKVNYSVGIGLKELRGGGLDIKMFEILPRD